ncbi:uncharacterized protein LOC144782893 isoform X2 [Lissotriton helveticus]
MPERGGFIRAQTCSEVVQITTFMVISIGQIVVGAIYLYDCNLEHRIPIYLLVNGPVNILIVLIGYFLGPHLMVYTLMRMLVAFSFGWLIAASLGPRSLLSVDAFPYTITGFKGSVWAFPHFSTYYGKCNNTLYLVTFASLIIQYAFLIMLFIYTLF